MTHRALVLFSGGQDSTVCLAWALQRYEHVETIGFAYGQRHLIELECREPVRDLLRAGFAAWGERLGVDHLLDLSVLGQISETALTRNAEIEFSATGLPNTFVPGRNLLFLTFAAALAYRRGIDVLVGGMCETDFSGYPDCRDATIQSLAETIGLGMEREVTIETPLMWLTKAQTWGLTAELGGTVLIDIVREHTHTCYMGDHRTHHAWGYGCGVCPACELRANGYAVWSSSESLPPKESGNRK